MAVIVVSDASPLRALHHLGLLQLCRDLYGDVIVPEAVQLELRRATRSCQPFEISAHPGFLVQAPVSSPAQFGVPNDLDAGETQAITLALELHANLLLMDERKATLAARNLGLATIGVFGLFLEAKRRGLIARVLPLVDRLVSELKFFASASMRQRLAELTGE